MNSGFDTARTDADGQDTDRPMIKNENVIVEPEKRVSEMVRKFDSTEVQERKSSQISVKHEREIEKINQMEKDSQAP